MTDYSSGSAAAASETPGSEASRSATASVSAGIAAANSQMHKPTEPGPRFPAEDSGRSLAAMAERDLDATMQLLAERAQYITGASGAAIALRRGQHKDMLCRASAGSNAPELGALLSMEYGLSGESVRTRQTLRCDDTERDTRVNREGCRQLGIASVVVMPVLREEEAIGVFELFSGKPNAFGERDVSALRRLSEMVETALKHATAMQDVAAGTAAVVASEPSQSAVVADEPTKIVASVEPSEIASAPSSTEPSLPAVITTESPVDKEQPVETKAQTIEAPESKNSELANTAPARATKTLFWSAIQKSASPPAASQSAEPGAIAVPAGLRNLHKCSACGFPVSQGRTLCVECEQKKWRGEPLAQTVTQQARQSEPADTVQHEAVPNTTPAAEAPKSQPDNPIPETAASQPDIFPTPATEFPVPEAAIAVVAKATDDAASLTEFDPGANPAPLLSAAMHSESWFAANKYVLAGLLVVALVIAAIVLLR